MAYLYQPNDFLFSTNVYKRLDYLKLAQDQDGPQWNRIKRETYYFGNPSASTHGGAASALARRENYKQSGHSKSFGGPKQDPTNASAGQEGTDVDGTSRVKVRKCLFPKKNSFLMKK